MIGHVTNATVALASAYMVAQEVAPGLDVQSIVEKFGIVGALAVVGWWALTKLSKQLDDNTQAVRDLIDYLKAKEQK